MQLFAKPEEGDQIQSLVAHHRLPLSLRCYPPLAPKALKEATDSNALLIQNGQLFWLVKNGDELKKITPDWTNLQKRVVRAGRKSELLLQAIKADKTMTILDGTAGFGVDSLLLASTGATVLALENHPVMALLLLFEYQRMQKLPHWQKLLSCIRVVYGDFLTHKFDQPFERVYLDPMFPSHSYHAKVGKGMQVLHQRITPPSNEALLLLMARAKSLLGDGGKVVIKRPISATPLGQGVYFANEVLRFERYE